MWPFGSDPVDRVKEVFAEHPVISELSLDLVFKKGTLSVSGSVPREVHKNVIEGVAKGINGVKSVDLSGLKVDAVQAPSAPQVTPLSPSSSPKVTPLPQTPTSPKVTPLNPTVPADVRRTLPTKQAPKVAASGPSKGGFKLNSIDDDPAQKARLLHQKVASHASLADDPLDIFLRGNAVVVRGAVDSGSEIDVIRSLAGEVGGINLDVSGVRVVKEVKKLMNVDDNGDVYYEIQSGDTLSELAQKYYGDGSREMYMRLAKANNIADPNKIFVGQKIVIPGTPSGPA